MTELFFKHRPNAEGMLETKHAARLNRILAEMYEDISEPLPPPEPLPVNCLRYPAFRSHVHRALAGLSADPHAKEELLRHLMIEIQKPEIVKEDAIVKEPEQLATVAGLEEVELLPSIEENAAEAACWMPMGPSFEQVQAHIQKLREGRAGEVAKVYGSVALSSSKEYGSLALESSKQVLELAREYGMSLSSLVASKSFTDQRLAGKAAALSLLSKVTPAQGLHCAPCVEKADVIGEVCHVTGGDSQLDEEIVGAAAFGPGPADVINMPEDVAQVAESNFVQAASPSEVSFALPAPPRPQAPTTLWRFNAGDGLHIDVRASADINSARTGGKVRPGVAFEVAREHQGADGVLYLQLADGSGWLFDHKPGVGAMCVRV